jgi:tRNA threonylcarbamoyladenosine biosynthesis protein TsaB
MGIDTSGRSGGVALVAPLDSSQPPLRRLLPSAERTARSLLPEIEKLLAEAGTVPAHLAGVVVTSGPGSFTGLRIGVAVAKILAYALKIPLVGLDTLEAMAEGAESLSGSRLWSVLDAQRGDLFVACRRLVEGRPQQLVVPTQVMPLPTFLGQLEPGDVVARVAPMVWEKELPAGLELASPVTADAIAAAAGRLAWPKLLGGETVSPFDLVPQYYRASAAEEKRSLGLA